MRPVSATALVTRLLAVIVALAAFLTACTNAPEGLEPADEVGSEAVAMDAPASETPSDVQEDAVETDAEAGQTPSAVPVSPMPRATPPTSAQEGRSVPLPEREPMRAPAPSREASEGTPAPRNTAAADAFWRRFQQAVRSRDRAAIARGLADEVRVGDQTFAKSSEQVQAVLQAIVEEESARDAYLAVDALTHGPTGSTFSTTAHYTIEGEPYEVEVFGTVREVAPGDWRLVEVGSR